MAASVSVYAQESTRELVAESACAVRGTSPSDAATAIMDSMTQAYEHKAAA